MGGGSNRNARTSSGVSGHSNGKCTVPPGESISANASKTERRTAICPAESPGFPSVRLSGYSIAARRGTLTEAVRSGILDNVIVENPAISILRCSSPTDQQQIGQAGTSTTTSTSSSCKLRIIAGAVFSSSSSGSMI
jgi:hypothetical protein